MARKLSSDFSIHTGTHVHGPIDVNQSLNILFILHFEILQPEAY